MDLSLSMRNGGTVGMYKLIFGMRSAHKCFGLTPASIVDRNES